MKKPPPPRLNPRPNSRTPACPAEAVTAQADAPPVRNKRLWALALGTAAVWHLDPAWAKWRR
jgi:hypothetical protein